MLFNYLLRKLPFNRLHTYLVVSFIGPFILTFAITLFVLLMQFFWKYIDDMVGKGLEFSLLGELIFYWAATLVPLSLPLAVLLSSIMTFGRFGEHMELTAIKSAGVSLIRFMMPLIIFVVILSGSALYFSDTLLPKAYLKAISLLYDIKKKKPTFSVQEGFFNNEIEGFSMKVEKKDEDGKTLYGLMLYDHTQKDGNRHVIVADKGEFYMTQDERALILKLYDGYQYKEMDPDDKKNNNYPHYRTHFKTWEKRFDMQQFGMERTDEDLFRKSKRIKNISQLQASIDTIEVIMDRKVNRFNGNVLPYFRMMDERFDSSEVANDSFLHLQLDSFSLAMIGRLGIENRNKVFNKAFNTIRQIRSMSKGTTRDLGFDRRNIAHHKVEWHRKYTLSVACLLMFLIGAPLGSIIKRGGLGWPLFWSIIIFIVYYVSGIFGEKLAEEQKLLPVFGMWLSSFILAPMGIFLTIKARNDAAMLQMEHYSGFMQYIINYFKKKTIYDHI